MKFNVVSVEVVEISRKLFLQDCDRVEIYDSICKIVKSLFPP